MLGLDQSVKNTWTKIQDQYQERSEIVTHLLAMASKERGHKPEILEAVAQALDKVQNANVPVNDLVSLTQFNQHQSNLKAALQGLLLEMESDPNFKGKPDFLDLKSQLQAIEDQIEVLQKDYNRIAEEYNVYISDFPNSVSAALFDFEKAVLFEF